MLTPELHTHPPTRYKGVVPKADRKVRLLFLWCKPLTRLARDKSTSEPLLVPP